MLEPCIILPPNAHQNIQTIINALPDAKFGRGIGSGLKSLLFERYSYSEREAEEQIECKRLQKQWLHDTDQIKSNLII
ncbi:unnamed protein product [Ilex paraguariensis]|uniref:Uncharacterized protein n=1 Tax=Ilex paraguariensis TaxID=185542 RepID=A0ABC8TJL1_9AQUA